MKCIYSNTPAAQAPAPPICRIRYQKEPNPSRSDILLALEKQQSLEYRGRFLGTEEEILLEEPIEIDGTKYMMGHTRQYVKGAVPYEEGLKNKTVKGIFTKALNEEVLLLEKE